MASAAKKPTPAKPSTEVVEKKAGALVPGALAEMFAADAGSGMENATAESFAMPFLFILQTNSPQVDETSGEAIEGAKAGMLFENIGAKLYDGKKGIRFIQSAYRRVFLQWGPRSGEGAGFKGEHTPEAIEEMRAAGKIVEHEGRLYAPLADGTVNDKKCDRFSDTRNHYLIIVDEDGNMRRAVMSLASTQVKKSRSLMSDLSNLRIPGTTKIPPTYATVIKATTIPESNDKGKWHGWKFELAGFVDTAEVYNEAKSFHELVQGGGVTVKYESEAAAAGGEAGTGDGKGGF